VKNPDKYLGNELKYIKRVLNSESWSSTSGSWTGTLEKEFARKYNTKYAVAFNSGTSTMHAALLAAGVRPGDEVISPALTVIMNTTSTIHANAIPVYADVNPDTFTIDPVDIKRKITPKTKAIMVVSLYGLPCDMDPIMDIAREYNLFVLEDNAECCLSTYKGKLTGTIGHMASYSFEESKHISCGEGGMLITNDEDYALAVRKTGNHGFKNLTAEEGRVKLDLEVFQNPYFKRHDCVGWNYRLPELNSAIALAQLERLDELIEFRAKSAELFIDVMKDCDFLVPQMVPEYCTHSYWALSVKYTGDQSIGLSWAEFRAKYISMGGDGIYGTWSVPYLEPVMANREYVKMNPSVYNDIHYEEGLCPVAESIQGQLMVFKTNYRSIALAEKKADILRKLIKTVS